MQCIGINGEQNSWLEQRIIADIAMKAKLQKTEADIALGERHIWDQRARILRLEQKGADAALAKELLNTFLQIQQLHQYRRNQLERELAWSP